MLRCSLLAVSSRHQDILPGDTDHEASSYQNQFLRLIIDTLPSTKTYDNDLVASVVLLRVYEEFEAFTDTYLHARGIGRLLAAIPTFAHSGGLAEAACWQSLRQSLVVSMQTQQPPTLILEYHDHSAALQFRDDGSCANVIVLLFAKILRLSYSSPTSLDEWLNLSAGTEAWNERRKLLFEPLYLREAGSNAFSFPTICMVNAQQVVAMQHDYICKMFLALYMPAESSATGFASEVKRRAQERDVSRCLALIIGLACANNFGHQAKLTAHHQLYAYGYYIKAQTQRQYVLSFPEFIQKDMGWTTSRTSELLQSQWRELEAVDKR